MRPHVKAFRDVAFQSCRLQGIPFKRFLDDRGLDDILTQADADNADPRELALRVLVGCCVEEGRFNNFTVGVLAVTTYLNERGASLGQQAFADLAAILKTTPTPQALRRWIDAVCP